MEVRFVMLDTETTGLNGSCDRIVELGCVEVVGETSTGNSFHSYLNPGRANTPGALRIHGLKDEFLREKPSFKDIATRFLGFICGAVIVAHNAPFDVKFLDRELLRIGYAPLARYILGVVDTQELAKVLLGCGCISLDSLCDRFNISRSERVLHGALIDAELLAQVYIALGRLRSSVVGTKGGCGSLDRTIIRRRLSGVVVSSSEEQLHQDILNDLDGVTLGGCAWRSP